MSRRLLVRPEAQAEIDDAVSSYERRRPGLGARFLWELDRVLARAVESPSQFPIVEEAARRAIVKKFPYGVYFVVDAQAIVVLAVLHFRRRPESLRGRG